MEGLIKGLIDVALDAVAGGGDDGRGARNHSDPPVGERSRSTWAEVVSSGQPETPESRSDHHSSPWNSRREENEARNDGVWEQVGQQERPERRSSHHSTPWSARKEESEGRSDGDWEEVGHKKKQSSPPPRRQHQVPIDNWSQYERPPSEQGYVNHVRHGVDIEPSREELADLSKACNRLWELDSNRMVPGKDYEIDCGEGKKVYQKGDMASKSLFVWISDEVFKRPTFSRFASLLDNYNPNEGCKEVVTTEEKHEQVAFIEEISRTAPITYLHKYLVSQNITSDSNEEFKEMMRSLWFGLYGRGGGSSCSSAFEHVFVGEIKGRGENEVAGFHNWIQFYLEEAKGKVDYQGYIFPRRHGQIPDSETQLLTIQFEWGGILKSLSSTLIGVSPEFEIALYTLCFFMGGEENHVTLGPYSVNIKCYRLGNDRIGSVFPIAKD